MTGLQNAENKSSAKSRRDDMIIGDDRNGFFHPFGVYRCMVPALCYNLIIPSGFGNRFFFNKWRSFTILLKDFPQISQRSADFS